MKFGKKILSLVITLAMVITLLPAVSFESFAEELQQSAAPADYMLYLRAENGEGKAYKNSVSTDNAIDLPSGLSYVSGVWIMNGFEFSTTSSYGVYFEDNAQISLPAGSVNKITVDYVGEDDAYGICSYYDITVGGSGRLDIVNGIAGESKGGSDCTYGVYTCSNFTLNGGTVNIECDNAYYGYGVCCYEELTVNGGTLNATLKAGCGEGGYGIYGGRFISNGGEVNAVSNLNEYGYGIYAYYVKFPFKGTVKAVGSYKNLYFYYAEGEGIQKTGKSDYMSYSGLYDPAFAKEYGLKSTINVQGYYNNQWIQTTCGNQGYHFEQSGLGNATVTPDAELVYGGHYVLLSYKVEADEEIENGRIGIWTDVMIGDNDYAPITIIKDEDTGKVTGYELVDDHNYACYNQNAKYMIYFDGYMISSAIDEDDFVPADRYWFGYWSSSSYNVYSQISPSNAYGSYVIEDDMVTKLTGTDSGMSVSWPVNLQAGESRTYYALLGIGDATIKEKPKFTEETIPVVTADGKATAVIENKVENKEDAGKLTLSVITTEGKELTVGDAPLELLTEETAAPFHMTATFTERQINARPGNYSVKTVRATNKGGMFTDYTFEDEAVPSTQVTLVPREGGLDLSDTQPGFESLLYEGWEWDKETGKLYFFGLKETGDEGIKLPGNAIAVVEKEGVEITVTGENKPAISSSGSLTIRSKDAEAGEIKIDAPVGIRSNGDVVIQTAMELNAAETAIQVGENGTLKIEDGASLTINLTDENAVMFKTGEVAGIRISIPNGYIVEGGSIDENGMLILEEGVKTLRFIDMAEVIVTFDYSGHGGVDVATRSVAKRSYLERPEDPEAFGWAFQGWATSEGKAWNFLTEAVTGKMTLFARWTKAETTERTVGDKTIDTGVAAMKASTVLVPEKQTEKEMVDEIMANRSASTVPTTLRTALSTETYEQIAEGMSNGQNLILGLNVDLVGCELTEETTAVSQVTIRYDVHPWYCIKENEEDEGTRYPISNEELNGKPITFRLPLTKAAAGFAYAKLRHYLENGEEDLLYLPICTTKENGKEEYYVNVSANQFSIFEMTFTNEKDEEEHVTPRDGEEEPNWWKYTDTGWMLYKGQWYNIQNNHLVKGWYYEPEDGNWYYFDTDTGIMKTGWMQLRDNWFYLNDDTRGQTWFLGEDGKYHFDERSESKPLGALYTGCTTPDGHVVDDTGAWVQFEEL